MPNAQPPNGPVQGVRRAARKATFATIADALANSIPATTARFGTFSTRSRPTIAHRKPPHLVSIAIAASNDPFCRPGKTHRETIGQQFRSSDAIVA